MEQICTDMKKYLCRSVRSVLSVANSYLTPAKDPFHHRLQAVAGDGRVKELFVLGLDAGHVNEFFDTLVHFKFACERGGVFLFDDVAALKPPRKIHRHEPTRQKTRRPERAADCPQYLFA